MKKYAFYPMAILFIMLFSDVFLCKALAGVKLISYGFEDWVGFDGINSPAPNYIFSTSYQSYWQNHMDGTGVIASCDGKNAYEGNYYFHNQFYTGTVDPCINSRPSSVNAHSNLGTGGGAYPVGLKNTVDLSSDLKSNILLLRFYFRCSGDWTSNQGGLDGGYGLKFIRIYGGDGAGDDSSILIKILNDDDSTNPRMLIYNPSTYKYTSYSAGINWQDGNWHSITLKAVRNNDNNSAGNVTVTIWIDDWNMSGNGYSATITVPDMGGHFHHISFNGNWSAKYPVANISIDMDKLELWDGLPDEGDTLPPPDDPPPGDVTDFTATPGDSQIALSWTNPADSDFSGTMIRYSTGEDPYPATKDDGILACDRTGAPGSNDSYTVTGLQNGVKYNFSAFTYDTAGNFSQTAHVSAIPQGDTGDEPVESWSATGQAGDSTWDDSGAVWCVRVLVEGDNISQAGNQVVLGFQGRSSGDYVVKKVSIAERDPNGGEGDVIDATWKQVTFDGKSVSTWGSDAVTVSQGTEKKSDPIFFTFEPGKSYYVTYLLESPSVYLIAPSTYDELYFSGSDHTDDIDWSSNGHSVYAARLHAISKIYVLNTSGEAMAAPTGLKVVGN